MNYRYTTLLAEKSFTADASELIDLNLSDPITRIRIELRAYASISQGTDEHVAKIVKKIELVDGSEVLYSLDGREAYAMQFYQNKVAPADRFYHIAGNYSDVTFLLDFGRWLFDPDLALDPKRFNNLQLRIETDQDAGGATVTAHRLEVMAVVFDQKKIAPAGMIVARRVKQYSMGSATHEYTDLPTDRKIRRLVIKTSLAGTELSQTLEYIKLTEDNDKHVICDHTVNDLIRAYPEENAPYDEIFWGNCGSAAVRNFHCTPGVRGHGVLVPWSSGAGGYGACQGPEGCIALIVSNASINFGCIVRGWCPMNSCSLPMGDEWDVNDWFDPTGLKNLRLDLLSLAAGSTYTCEIDIQQLRMY